MMREKRTTILHGKRGVFG